MSPTINKMNKSNNVFQGGAFVEVFSPVKKELMTNVSISKHAKKVYDKSAKTFVYILDGESTEMQLRIPKDSKISLSLIQPYLVLQLFVNGKKGFRFEVIVCAGKGFRKRIIFSNQKTTQCVKVSNLSASVPFDFQHKKAWMHVCINVHEIVSTLWNEDCKSIDALSFGGCCSIRQIYTVREDVIMENNSAWEELYLEQLPRQCRFPVNVLQAYHLISKHFISSAISDNVSSQIFEQQDSSSSKLSIQDSQQSKRNFKSTCSNSTNSGSVKPNKRNIADQELYGDCLKVTPIRAPSELKEETKDMLNTTVVLHTGEPEIPFFLHSLEKEDYSQQELIDSTRKLSCCSVSDEPCISANVSEELSLSNLSCSSPTDIQNDDNADDPVGICLPSASAPIADALTLARKARKARILAKSKEFEIPCNNSTTLCSAFKIDDFSSNG